MNAYVLVLVLIPVTRAREGRTGIGQGFIQSHNLWLY